MPKTVTPKSPDLTAEQTDTARKLGKAMIDMSARKITADEFRAVARESRERWGEDLHEVLKGAGVAMHQRAYGS